MTIEKYESPHEKMVRKRALITPEMVQGLGHFVNQKPAALLVDETKPTPKIVVALQGGVGNQLFQYAFGISIARARRQEVGFTIHRLKDRWRPAGYQLDMFVDDIKLLPRDVEKEPFFTGISTFQPGVYTVDIPKTFFGYWQTEKYFNIDLVREKINFRYPLGDQSLKVAEQIAKAGKASAFLHVRRGADYKRNDVHSLASMRYYSEAVKRVCENYEGAKFFVFGDDPVWMREQFSRPEFVIVDHIKPDTNGIHEDVHLMSLCQNGAIANSSFSWWGAWLGDTQPNRLIFAPDKWFGDSTDISDLVPDRWTKLPCAF